LTTIISNGLVNGAIYGLVALGITLIYKKSSVLNFANAEAGMVGAFVFFALSVEQNVQYLLAAVVGIAVAALIGGATYLLLVRRRNEPLNMLIGTLGVAGLLTFIGLEIWGVDPHFIPAPLSDVRANILGLRFIGPRLIVLIAGIVLAGAFFLLFRYTRMALLFRASASDPYAAVLMGINVVRLDLVTWSLAGALAGLAGVLVAPLVGFHVFFMTLLGIRGFAASLLAGLVNVPATLAAGLALGLAEASLTRATTQPGLPEAVLVAFIVVVLFLRPQRAERKTA
jgi:branched-chain amino acid transport system permease protein